MKTILLTLCLALTSLASSPDGSAEPLAVHDARVVPAFRDGKCIGFKLVNIRRGSAIERDGVKNGDVLVRVNGVKVASPDDALEARETLRTGEKAEVEMLRGAKTVILKVDLR